MPSVDVRHQVFVSSTYIDLVDQRRHVMQALLELDCIPGGMELFPASDHDAWSLIKQVIDESDYYLVIIGGRYGSMTKDGISFTRKEYEYARDTGKPIMGFLHRDPSELRVKDTEVEEDKRLALQDFRELVERKQCAYWNTAEELGGIVSRGIVKLRKSHPRPGWVRADSHGDLALREHIVELEAQLLALRAERAQNATVEHLSLEGGQQSVKLELELDGEPVPVQATWNEILVAITPIVLDPIDARSISSQLGPRIATLLAVGDGHAYVSEQSTTQILIHLMAAGALRRRGYEYQLTETGIGVAASLQLRGS